MGICLWLQPAALFPFLSFVQRTGENKIPELQFSDHQFVLHAGLRAGHSLMLGGLILAVMGVALLLAQRRLGWRWVPLALLPLELVYFAKVNLLTTPADNLTQESMKAFLAKDPGDYRIINPLGINSGYLVGVPNLWGDNPSALKRYAEFLAFTQGENPDLVHQAIGYNRLTLPLSLLRLRYAFVIAGQNFKIVEYHSSLPHALLFTNYQVRPGRDAIFAEFDKPDFNPGKTVFLESEPTPRPELSATLGTVKLTEVNGDLLDIVADTATPAILLITDLYSRDWQARPLAGSAQTHYDILPGDYILRAIPLQAGHHHLAVEYHPRMFDGGLIVSGVAWLTWLVLMTFSARRLPVGPQP